MCSYFFIYIYEYREVPKPGGKSGLVMVQKVAVRCEVEAGLRYATTGRLSLSTLQ